MSAEPLSVLDLPDYDIIKQRAHREIVLFEGHEYEVVSSIMIRSWQMGWNVSEHLQSMIKVRTESQQAGVWGPVDDTEPKVDRRNHLLRDKLDHIKAGGSTKPQQNSKLQQFVVDGLKNPVDAVMTLRPQATVAKHEDDQKAIGGMRNPLNSLDHVPNHGEVGLGMARVLDTFLDEHPHVSTTILHCIGVEKSKATPLKDYDIGVARDRMAQYLEADLSQNPGLTEVSAPLFVAWQRKAKDPDVALVRWLLEGAPAGIEKHPESLGIFPQSEAAPSKDFELSFATGYADFNYTSMDESPYSQEVLDELVNAGYVTKCESIAAAIQHFGG